MNGYQIQPIRRAKLTLRSSNVFEICFEVVDPFQKTNQEEEAANDDWLFGNKVRAEMDDCN